MFFLFFSPSFFLPLFPSFSCFFSCFLFFGSWIYAMGHGVKKCRPFPRVIARIHLAITSMNVSCRFVQDALAKTCSSFCRHAEFKYMFDLKISLVTRASSLKTIQLLTFIIVLWPSERGTMQCEENNRNRMSMQKWNILQRWSLKNMSRWCLWFDWITGSVEAQTKAMKSGWFQWRTRPSTPHPGQEFWSALHHKWPHKSLQSGSLMVLAVKPLKRELELLQAWASSWFHHVSSCQDAFTHRNFYTQTHLCTQAFTHRRFYTQTLLHTDSFAHRHSWHTEVPFYQVLDGRASFRAKGLCRTRKNRNFTAVFADRTSFRANLISCERVATDTSKLQFYLSFWRSKLVSCEKVAFRAVSLALPCALREK